VTRARRRVTVRTRPSKWVSPPALRHSDSSWYRSSWVLAAGLIAAVLVVYAPALNNGFINLDDPQYVLENPHVRSGLTWQGAAWAMTADYAGNWHPLTWLSHMTDVQLFDLHPSGHHATSIVIHLLNTLLLFALLRRMTAEPLRSAVVAGLFAVHPLHVESVAWVAERKDTLSTLFAMLTLWTYLRYVETKSAVRYALVLVFFALGLAAKPMLVTLPFLLLLLDIWPLGRVAPAGEESRTGLWDAIGTRQFRALLLEKAPLFLVALASSVLTYVVQQKAGAVRSLEALPMHRRLTNAVVAYAAYILKTIWPTDLAPLYPYSPTEPQWRVAFAAVSVIGLTVMVSRAGTRYRYAAVGWFWYLGTLVPVIGLVQVGSQPIADRYTYLPVVGLFIVIVWGLSDALQHAPAGRFLLATAATTAILVSIIVARQQVAIWGNSVDLWQHTLSVTRNNYRAHNNLAQALAVGGKSTDALSHYQAALGINPDSVEAHTGMADVLATTGRLEDAVSHYRRALQVRPDDTTARINLGAALAEQKKFVEAEADLRAVLEAAPNLAAAHSSLGVALLAEEKRSEAIGHFSRAVELQPFDTTARRYLGSALMMEGRTDDAIVQLETAVRQDPADALSRNALGAALAAAGKLDAAVSQYEDAVRLNPALADPRANLGNSLARLGRFDEARMHLQEAVRLNPGDSGTRYDLAIVLWRQGQVADARQQLEEVVRQNPRDEAARRLLTDLKGSPDK